jgi:hypothetical protein
MIAACAYLFAASQWMLIDAELYAGMELDAMAWRSACYYASANRVNDIFPSVQPVICCLVSCMPQPAPHRLRQTLTSQATVMQTPTVWLPGRMQHGRAGKVIGCLHE